MRVLPAGSPVARRLRTLTASAVPANSLEFRCELFRLIALLIAEVRRALDQGGPARSEVVRKVVLVLEQAKQSDFQGLSVEDLARQCGCSRRHLTRLVNEEFGCSIIKLKTQLKLQKAATLLHDPEAKVVNVALDCGFNHLGTFTAKFKKHFGTTPAKWREKLLAHPAATPATPTVGPARGRLVATPSQQLRNRAYAPE
jgi:AraC family transcriptional activator of mar-sox-rob regulon